MGAPSTVRWSGQHDPEAVDAWGSLPASSRWDTSFAEPSFLGAIAEVAGLTIEQITVSDEAGVAAAARIAVQNRFGLARSYVPPFTPYSAIRLRSDVRESEIHERNSALEPLMEGIERRFRAAALHLPPPIQDLRILTWRGWHVRPLYTYRVSLSDTEDPLDDWSESARRIARQQSPEYEIVDANPETQAQLVFDGYVRNDRKPPLGKAGLAAVIRTLHQSGVVTTYAARNRSSLEIEAAVTVLAGDREAYYWLAGSKPGPSMTVLLATLLPELASTGVTLFDFVGANTASIAEFKRRFGGQLSTYFRAAWQKGIVGRIVGAR